MSPKKTDKASKAEKKKEQDAKKAEVRVIRWQFGRVSAVKQLRLVTGVQKKAAATAAKTAKKAEAQANKKPVAKVSTLADDSRIRTC